MADGDAPRVPLYLRFRRHVQLAAAFLLNARFLIDLRGVCFPALNCWACPTAGVACPLGALQNSMPALRVSLLAPLYILGSMLAASALIGRAMCGWLCPFGLVQDLLARVRKRHWRLPRWAGYSKYVMLLGLALIIPYLTWEPWFCKLCPQGALQGSIFQPIVRPELREALGGWWALKIGILVAFLISFVLVRRPFCHAFCPLGAIFSLCNRVSLIRMHYDRERCTDCMWCVRECPAGIDPRRDLGSNLCVSCMECAKCPFGAIRVTTALARPPVSSDSGAEEAGQ
ncbi:MAG: 4Fe-4S binding protein [Armatimonadota bacterium]